MGSRKVEQLLRQADDAHRSGNFIGAVEAYSEAIGLDPSSASIYHSRAAPWLAAKEFDTTPARKNHTNPKRQRGRPSRQPGLPSLALRVGVTPFRTGVIKP